MAFNTKQDRDGLPDAIIEERRFFELYGPGKTDAPTGWNNPDNWKELDEIPNDKYFGFAIGNGTNYLFIDCDHARDPKTGKIVPWIEKAVLRLCKVCKTYGEISQSGTGFHLIADLGDYADCFGRESNGYNQIIVAMDPDQYNKLSKEEKDVTPKIEFFYHTDGRYIFLTGKHKELVQVAENESAAALFTELLKIRQEHHEKYAKKEFLSDVSKIEIDEPTRQRVLEALPYISANSREIWVRVGQALFNCGFPFDLWDEWSQFTDQRNGVKCDKYKAEETPKIWKSFTNTKSHWNAGTIIALAKENGYATPAKSPSKGFSLCAASSVEAKEMEWLIPGYIPRKQITIIGAAGGVGKTTVECAIAAAVSAGTPCFLESNPFDPQRDPERVLLLAPEDPFDEVIKPRLMRNGANDQNIFFVPVEDDHFLDINFNSDALREIIEQSGAKLVILDPIQQFIPPDINMGYRNAMRKCMTPLLKLAKEYDCTFLIAAHCNKRETSVARNALSDSSDIWDIARSVLMMDFTDKHDIVFVSHEKCNGAPLDSTVLISFDDGKVNVRGKTENRWKFYHSGYTQAKAAPVRDDVKETILDLLEDGTKKKTEEIKDALKAMGYSSRTIERAKADLKREKAIRYEKGKFDGEWYMVLGARGSGVDGK